MRLMYKPRTPVSYLMVRGEVGELSVLPWHEMVSLATPCLCNAPCSCSVVEMDKPIFPKWQFPPGRAKVDWRFIYLHP